ncbi:MAG: phenylalanine--tRNA ligase subunit beta [Gammaproteobacteria bacterium RIFCSPHIGHO2_12_FULL_38_14]|nr:MAG: phenylalanine--tRNA ligase subunit beta [Gammaproteobacteria bacterium RIFCSPHIGHO2_12_FULL_38_14]
MKFNESWLHEWVNPQLTREDLARVLTMSGFEIESLLPVAEPFTQVVIGQILKIEKHPKADRLQLCEVNVGSKVLSIVCGAQNIKIGMKVPVALIGAVLPNNLIIRETAIRGINSYGMLCSSKELALAEESDGIFVLPDDAPIGESIRNYLHLDDYIFDVSITPNRGDCLSVRGISREIATLTQSVLKKPLPFNLPDDSNNDVLPVEIQEQAACPYYLGRIIRGIRTDAATPLWMKERLERCGMRSIHFIVDVANYIMLELGQPMHAFDLQKINSGIIVRYAHAGEKIILLDGSEKNLNTETLIIADQQKPLAIAGIMGGLESSVNLSSQDIFLESAFFSPQLIAKMRQYYQLNSDAAYRFERGVDPTIQKEAILRATQLILEIAGGKAGPLCEVTDTKYLPKTNSIFLHPRDIETLLGIIINTNEIEKILDRLSFSWERHKEGFKVVPPSHRFDVTLPEDIIEDIARLYGYDRIPALPITAKLSARCDDQKQNQLSLIRQVLRDQAYHEIITYSFVDKHLQMLLNPQKTPYELANPITSEMAVMRTNLWPGLINAFRFNKNRNQHRVRLFEIGTSFVSAAEEKKCLAGLLSGLNMPEQWGEAARSVDYYDLKQNIENILNLLNIKDYSFNSCEHPALHPGESAEIVQDGQKIGLLGALHPETLQKLDLTNKVYVFELALDQGKEAALSQYKEQSKFPEIRRDLALLVNQAIPLQAIQDTIIKSAGDWLKEIFIFDVYEGKGIAPGLKSMAFAITLQHPTRTLVDEEVTALMEHIVQILKEQFAAVLRS